MNPDAHPQPDEHARQLITLGVPSSFFLPPLRPPLSPAQTKHQLRLFQPPPRPPHRAAAPANPVAAAQQRGYQQGRRNAQTEPCYNYSTSAEWLAWLSGWRRGQRQRHEAPRAQ